MVIGELSDSLTNIHSVKLFSSRRYEYKRLQNTIANDFIPKEIKTAKFRFKVDIFNSLMGITILLVMILIMIKLKQNNAVSVGDFVFVFGMVFQLQENLWHLIGEFNKLSDHMGDLKSSLAIYKADKSEYKPDEDFCHFNIGQLPQIEFKNLGFKFNEHKSVFSDLNLTIKSGEHIGIVGLTGAGKTTLINLLLKVYEPQIGGVYINDVNISHIDCDELRKHIAVIPQDILLFHRNLMENIRYGKLDATDQEVIEAANKAHVNEFIDSLPEGYYTMVGERGIKLSGGQRQRIAIARAILKNSPILILDEATSALDSITEKYIQNSIKTLFVNKTVLAIAHRLSTLKHMDKLIVVENGTIVETGTHDELLTRRDSLYKTIWNTQYLQ